MATCINSHTHINEGDALIEAPDDWVGGLSDSSELRAECSMCVEQVCLSGEHREREVTTAEIVAGTRKREALAMAPTNEPREYQRTAVELLRARGRLLLTDEVGLGKTFTGLPNFVNADALPALVVPPPHLPDGG